MHSKKVTLKVFRFNAKTDYLPYYKTYELEVSDHEVMLDLLNRVKWDTMEASHTDDHADTVSVGRVVSK